MFTHQIHNSVGEQIYNAYLYKNILYAAHLHRGYEFVHVLEGELCAIIDGKTYSIPAGQSLLLSPYQIHSYEKDCDSLTFVAVFSENYIPYFASSVSGKKARSPLFTLSSIAKDFILSVLMPKNVQMVTRTALPEPNDLSLKAALYAICAEFSKQTEFIQSGDLETSLLLQCLLYIEENYNEDVSLKSMAAALGYNQEYLSRIFNKGLGVHFKTMLHQYRCEKAQQMIIDTKESMATIAMECGFQSIRTFNRVFKETMGKSPSSLRE